MKVGEDKEENISKAESFAKELSQKGANVVVLPEMFNCPYEMNKFSDFAENIPGETTDSLSKLAQELNVYLIGGSIPVTT